MAPIPPHVAPEPPSVPGSGARGEGVGEPSAEGADERRQKRLARNRESARQSRRRKKEYLGLLEEKVTQLSEEVVTLRHAHLESAEDKLVQLRRQEIDKLEAEIKEKV